jgi:hypothetical protein
LAAKLTERRERFAPHLLEAEFLSAYRRQNRRPDLELLEGIDWISPSRPLTQEITRVLEAGYLKGADCWHLACALFLSPDPSELLFLTLNTRQQEVAEKLGFQLADR